MARADSAICWWLICLMPLTFTRLSFGKKSRFEMIRAYSKMIVGDLVMVSTCTSVSRRSIDRTESDVGRRQKQISSWLLGIMVVMLNLGSLSFGVFAQPPTDRELQFLPPYCRAQRHIFSNGETRTRTDVSEERKKWEKILGPAFAHVHHYCWGLNYISRALRTSDETQRSHLLRRSIKEIQYVQVRVGREFAILPEMLVKKGLVYQLLGEHARAVSDSLAAIDILPSYSPAYAILCDSYLELGNVEEAQRALTEGVLHAPNSKLLRRKLDKLLSSSRLKQQVRE